MSEEIKQQTEIEETEQQNDKESSITLPYQNKQDDLMSGMEAVDIGTKENKRKIFHVLAVLLVGYWGIESIMQKPDFLLSWLMLAAAGALGFYIWREPRAGNLKYTARFVDKAPEGTVTINEQGVFLEDGTGRDPFLFSDGMSIFRYEKILAIYGKKRRLAMIPLYQFSEDEQTEVVRLIEKSGTIEMIEKKQTSGGFFKR